MPVQMILAKPEDIQQVFFNIIHNGVQAIGAQGSIEISTCDEDDKVCVKISDQGTGIRKELLGKIFDPFLPPRDRMKGMDWLCTLWSRLPRSIMVTSVLRVTQESEQHSRSASR